MLRKIMKKEGITVEDILNSIRVGIYITDGEGTTLLLNEEGSKNGGLTSDEVVGKNMKELMDMGYVKESDSFEVMESGKEVQLIQNLGDGGKIFITGVPIYKNGKIVLIVSTERDIKETDDLKALLQENKEKNEQYKTEVEYLRQSMLFQGELVCVSHLMKQVLEQAKRISKLDATVLIQGESGTGKEVVADYIYKTGDRADGVFIKINCAAIPETLIESELFGYEDGAFTGAIKNGKIGLFEAASGGTIFLDEIGDLPLSMQAKLLRTIQNKEIRRIGSNKPKEIDVKIIAASNINLKDAVSKGIFREDLYYRLSVATIEVPPLRSRKDDIEPLALHFIEKMNDKYGFEKSIEKSGLEALKEYNWPGNIRELKNIIERLMINSENNIITKFQLIRQINGGTTYSFTDDEKEGLKDIIDKYEAEVLLQYLEKYGTLSKVADALKVDKGTISRKIKKLGISK